MKLVRWTRFTWDLARLSHARLEPTPPYRIRTAANDEKAAVLEVIFGSFVLDMDWNDILDELRDRLESEIDLAFSKKAAHFLVLTNGGRLIGASALTSDPGAENQLISGPCVLNEYRNRGFGSALLYSSLSQLRDTGLSHASGVTRRGSPADKFLYPKFDSGSEPCEFGLPLVEV